MVHDKGVTELFVMVLVLFATVRPTNISSSSSDVVSKARRAFTRSGSAVHYVPTPKNARSTRRDRRNQQPIGSTV